MRIAEKTIELREREHIAPDSETPQRIVDEVLRSEGPQRVRRGTDYSNIDAGMHESIVCSTNPYDCKRAISAHGDSIRLSVEHFPGPSGDNTQDADRHCIWQELTTIRANADFARKIGDAHEKDHPSTPEAERMDQANNATGRDIGLRHEGDEAGAINECRDLAASGRLVTLQ